MNLWADNLWAPGLWADGLWATDAVAPPAPSPAQAGGGGGYGMSVFEAPDALEDDELLHLAAALIANGVLRCH